MANVVLERRVCQTGEFIFRQGDEGDCAYIVQAGQVDIVKVSGGDDETEQTEVVLGSVGEGGIFGEMALIDNFPRMAGARAAQMSTIIIVNRRMFDQKMAKTDPFIRGLLKIFAGNIRAMSPK